MADSSENKSVHEQLVQVEDDTGSINADHEVEDNNKCSGFCAKNYITIEPALCAAFLALNLCDVVLTNLIMSRTCEVELKLNKTECDMLASDTDEGQRVEALVQPYASLIITGKSWIGAILPSVMSLYLGPWSDYNGRKCLLLSPMLGLAISLLTYAGLSLIPKLHPLYLLLGTLPFSFSGGFINLISTSYSYISDTSSEENRALRLGLLESSLYVGTFIGVLSSSRTYNIDKNYGYIINFCIGALVSLVGFLYTIFLVPESIHRNQETQQDVKGVFKSKFLKEVFHTSFKKRENYGRACICMAMFAMTTTIVTLEGESNLLYLFTRLRFKWNLSTFTTWLSVFVVTHFIGLLVGCIVLTKFLKISDAALGALSFLTKVIECTFYALIPTSSGYLMYVAQATGLLSGLSGPSLRSVLSKTVPSEDVGKVFSLASSLESLLPLACTPIYTVLYNATFHVLPGAFFLLSASFFMLNVFFCSFIYFVQRRFSSNQTYSHIADDEGLVA